MPVRLISYTQIHKPSFIDYDPDVGGIDYSDKLKNVQDIVAYCARVSNPSNQMNQETNEKLIRYLLKHKHFSPFEMVTICLEIKTTRDIGRQILRHKSAFFQEMSQRYSKIDDSFIVREARLQDAKNRQNSIDLDMLNDKDRVLAYQWENLQRDVAERSKSAYEWALEHGIAKEQARAVLPEGMTPSTLYMNATLRTWLHYIELRSAVETQKEHRQVAIDCAAAIEPIFPMIMEFVYG